jgi:hypothetical protein
MKKEISEREQALFDKIKGMSYQEALDKYLSESIAIELEKSNILQEYSSLAITHNIFILRRAKKRIYENRGTEVRNKESANGAIVLLSILLIYNIYTYIQGYTYSPFSIYVFGIALFSTVIYKLSKRK